jgi:hypothetical protein
MSLVLDSPTERTVYESLTEEQQLTFLEHLRERRLSALKVYEELQASKKLATNEKLVAKAEGSRDCTKSYHQCRGLLQGCPSCPH